jgi:hypothetical protein
MTSEFHMMAFPLSLLMGSSCNGDVRQIFIRSLSGANTERCLLTDKRHGKFPKPQLSTTATSLLGLIRPAAQI